MATPLIDKDTQTYPEDGSHARILVGTGDGTWIWAQDGWDLTHREDPSSEFPETTINLDCELSNIKIDAKKTTLVITDMQNIGLHKALGPQSVPAMYDAQAAILQYAIPAARKLGLQIIWLNWGLTEQDLSNLPPAGYRVWAFPANSDKIDFGFGDRDGDPNDPANFIKCGERPDLSKIPGKELGSVTLEDGSVVDAGRAMMRDAWNTALHGALADEYEAGKKAARPDVLVYKNRNSGLWNADTDLAVYLKREGLRTLLFCGVNTDQCVGATLQDAHAQGFDTVMLKDGCATDSLPYAKATYEFNCAQAWGFLTSCMALAKAADLSFQ
ncbi:isochorismatase family protein [Cordyceps fumosorosea ARSEF 2679]|uniref:Isochorismatase family protein n=1 Tax=Cordyceps fumosorosea (strain ARSEF 2679) TaxID=1081104 RepID=A0A167RNQ1_CORFA|nr:isochorismatase family protein [Cordyceps fumosorosea ARSEF 2679]OAA58774.1 isochorismatase family protein [Cordyceps fumosorosea ARSEF 2679]